MFSILTAFVSCAYYLEHEEKSFIMWMRSNDQIYYGDEYKFRFGIYLTNSRLVREHNRRNKKFTVSLNKFAAYTPSEYRALLGFKRVSSKRTSNKTTMKTSADSIDWRDRGVVNGIKDMSFTPSSLEYGAIAAVESSNAISTGTLVVLSEKELNDCVHFYSSYSDLFDYVIKYQKGTFCENDYTCASGCCFDQCKHAGSISGYVNVVEGDEDDLALKVEYGPVAAAIDPSNWSFQLYSGGIYDDPCESAFVDYGVCVVGFGIESGTKYWIVRNAWGTSWGERGYIRMIRKNNQCGIASMATLPLP